MLLNIKGRIKIIGRSTLPRIKSIYLFFNNRWRDTILWSDFLIFSKD